MNVTAVMSSSMDVNPEDSGVSPLWKKNAPPLIALDSLEGEHETNIAIIGAGIAGLSTACHLARSGIQATVLDAAEPGENATGKSGGIVASLPARHSPLQIIKQYGEGPGKKLLSLFGNSGKYTFSLIDELKLNCSPQANGFLAPARAGRVLEKLKNIGAEWRSYGYDIQYLDENSIARLSGLDIYGGALLDPDGGAINPFAYARELARVVTENGARIYTHSRVTDISRVGGAWCLKTARGKINAKKVILCAGGDNRRLDNALMKSIIPLSVFEFSTEPLPAEIRKKLLPEGHVLTDIHSDILTLRYDTEGRLITACPAFLFSNTTDRAIAAVTARLKTISSLFDSIHIEDIWQGTAWLETSLMPRFYNLAEGLYAIQACNGRGLAINTILGREVAQVILSGSDRTSFLVSGQPQAINPYSFMYHAPGLLTNAVRYRNRVIDKLKNVCSI